MTPTDALTAAFLAAVDVLERVSKNAADYRIARRFGPA